MAVLVLLALFLGFTGHSTANWCVCKDGVGDPVLQKALDYACGAGADCNPIHSNGPCYNPNTVKAHCSYAVNSYFQRKGQAQGSCDFSGSATVATTDPSTAGCSYPSSASTSGTTSTTPVTGTPGTTTPTTTPSTTTPTTNTPGSTTPGSTTPGSTTPYTTTPSTGTGVLGGVGPGLGPSGSGMPNTDYSHGGMRLQNSALSFLVVLLFSGSMLLWG
ncbi:plasmodesmata callose-binding protein 3 [Citrus sinensis]|uniref:PLASMODESMATA CALLOSE-BINDING PROTEIN 3 isoform X1 n=1 Tax=Citrus sinensis TaxID=2711 RepID=UPI0021A08D29|nr:PLASMODESMATA CALLOSE-BINDING PROTEIN 3 isoform X1 [Citrus sinensis]KAH9722158.1 plasmodesmata callose-binding protein 3 [Citrus sinensis]